MWSSSSKLAILPAAMTSALWRDFSVVWMTTSASSCPGNRCGCLSQHDPEPSQPPPRLAEHEPEPTADGEPEPNATEPSRATRATVWRIATEPEPIPSDQVREPAALNMTVDVSVEHEGAEESIAHCTAAEGELSLELGQMDLIDFYTDIYADMPPLLPPSFELSACPKPPLCLELSTCLDFTPLSPHLLSALLPQLCHRCLLAAPLLTLSPTSVRWARPLWLEDPSSPPPDSEFWTPPRPSDPVAPPWLPAPSSPLSPVGPPAPPGSLIPPALPWSVVVPPSPQDSTPLAAPRRSVPPAPLGSSLPPAPPQSSVGPTPLRTFGFPSRLPEPWDHRLSVFASGSTSTSTSIGRPPGVVSPFSTMAPLSVGSAVDYHHGCGLGLAWLLLLRVPSVSSLAPPSVRSTLVPSVSSLAPPAVVTTLDFVCCPPPRSPFSTRASSYTDFLLPSHIHSFVFVFVYGTRSRLPGGGSNVTPLWTVYVGFSLLHSVQCLSSGLVNMYVYFYPPVVDLPVLESPVG
ncbi:Chromatin-remodeling ATPase INO80 [Labeo rohita]|uniref:Chromatin-remodeling ATPase INO80 n=1 Tax=Labeo rohita TaxID=84645 RepID=A0ABQ8LT73_LABRO|nr:Chromatin-remodeling ATPase INO80 [Labeo rohita]